MAAIPWLDRTGPRGLVQQKMNPDFGHLAWALMEAQQRQKRTQGQRAHRATAADAKEDIARIMSKMSAAKDQSRLGGLPPGPMPDPDVTGNTMAMNQEAPKPVALPLGVAAQGEGEPFVARAPKDEPRQQLTEALIQQAYKRNPQRLGEPAAPTPPMVASAPAPQPKPDEPIKVATTTVRRPPAEAAQGTGGGLGEGIRTAAAELGVDPVDLATAISYETAGTFNPTIKGPKTKWGRHRGLIQWGEPQAQKYINGDFSIPSQMAGIVRYLKDAGVQSGHGLMDIYSAINAGRVGRYGASDAKAGGAPGTVADKVNNQMAGHRQKALALLGGEIDEPVTEDWMTGGEGRSFASAPQTPAEPSPVMAYSGEPTMQSSASPQAALIAALMKQAGSGAGPAPALPMGGGVTPMMPPTELSSETPIVAGGGNVRPVSFGGGPATPQGIEGQKMLAEAMMARGMGERPIRHPLQGLAQMSDAAFGGLNMAMANRKEAENRQMLVDAMMKARGGGSLDALYQADPGLALRMEQQRAEVERASQTAQQERVYEMRDAEADHARRMEMERFKVENRQPDLTTDQRNFEAARSEGYEGSFQDWVQRTRQAGAGNVNVDLGGDKFADAYGKGTAERALGIEKGGSQALGKLTQFEQLGSILERTNSGSLAPARASIGAVMQDLGVDPSVVGISPDLPTNAQTLNGLANRLVTASIGGEEGFPANNFSDADRDFITRTLPNLASTPGANRLLLDAAMTLENVKVERARSWARARQGAITDGKDLGEAFRDWEGDWAATMQANDYFGNLVSQTAQGMLSFPNGMSPEDRREATDALADTGFNDEAAARIQEYINRDFGAR